MKNSPIDQSAVRLIRWRHLANAGYLLCHALLLSGCGESTEDMMLRAMRRNVAEEPEAAKVEGAASPLAPEQSVGGSTDQPEAATNAARSSVAQAQPATAVEPAPPGAPVPSRYPPPGPIDHSLAGVADIADRSPSQPVDPKTADRYYITNLQRIGEALKQNVREQDALPFPNIQNLRGEELLSWRVRFLRSLGYNGLYEQFRLDEPWNSPHNLQLLPLIPPEYINPERFDDRTSVFAVRGPGLAYDPDARRFDPADIPDGKAQTLVIVEGSADQAVPWTMPNDFEPVGDAPATLYVCDGRVMGVLGDARPVAIDAADTDVLQRAFTAAGGDGPDASAFAALELLQPPVAATGDTATASDAVASQEQLEMASGAPAASAVAANAVPARRQPVPPEVEIEDATDVLRELYAERLQKSHHATARCELATEMLTAAERMHNDTAGKYALLRAARVVAAGAGNVELSWSITERIISHFEVEALEERAEGLQLAHRTIADPRAKSPAVTGFVRRCLEVLYFSVKADRYDIAEVMLGCLATAAARSPDVIEPQRHANLRREVHRARAYYRQTSEALRILDSNPGDQEAAEKVGRYICFVKGDWATGIVVLARGTSPVARAASREPSGTSTSEDMLLAAGRWYGLGKRSEDPLTRTGALGRAAYWYARAAADLDGSLKQLTAKVRLDELEHQGNSLLHSLAVLANDHGAEIEVM